MRSCSSQLPRVGIALALIASSVVLLARPRAALAQSARPSGPVVEDQVWGSVTVQASLPARFAFMMDAHARVDVDAGASAAILRPALGYRLGRGFHVWLGYAWTPSRGARGLVEEHRVFQQLTWGTPFLRKGKLSLRSRLEERFVERADVVGLRFRQVLRVSWALGDGPLYVAVSDEVFFHLNDADYGARTGFDQNRVWIGPGVNATKELRVEVGYLSQYIARPAPSADLLRHVASVNVFATFD